MQILIFPNLSIWGSDWGYSSFLIIYKHELKKKKRIVEEHDWILYISIKLCPLNQASAKKMLALLFILGSYLVFPQNCFLRDYLMMYLIVVEVSIYTVLYNKATWAGKFYTHRTYFSQFWVLGSLRSRSPLILV